MTRRRSEFHMFVSYSHLDRDWFGKLQPLLKFRTRTHVFREWHDNELKAGDRWDDEIRKALDRMDVFLCLLSNYFIASDYIMKVEVEAALAKERQRRTIIVPLLLNDMDPRDLKPFIPFNPIPAWDKSWRSFEKNGGMTMDAHKPIRKGLLDVLEKLGA